MPYPITPPAHTTLPIYGSDGLRFPVHNIYCVARNYADHAREMGQDPDREPPFFFMKPANAVMTDCDVFKYPPHSEEVHHEVEMVVALRAGGRNIPAEKANRLIYGYGIGLDMTCRDVQAGLKQAGRPWEWAKAFTGSAPCSQIMPSQICGHPTSAELSLRVNDELRQQGNIEQMIWNVSELISVLSTVFQLEAGDIIFTGTPAGVGPVRPGDTLQANLKGIADLNFKVA